MSTHGSGEHFSPSIGATPASFASLQTPSVEDHDLLSLVPLSVIVLAGGGSTRMGRNKLWLMLDGQPLIERVVRRVCPLTREIILSTNSPQQFAALCASVPVAVQTVADLYAGAGPLAGLHAGLSAASRELSLLVAADMPFVSLSLARYLAGQAEDFDAVVPLIPSPHIAKARIPMPSPGELVEQPLFAIYRRTCLPAIAACLDAADYRMFSFLSNVRTRYVKPDELRVLDPDLRSFFNVNTPADWHNAQRLALID